MANAVKRGWQEVSLVAYSITLSGQDITSHVDQMSIKIEDALGQGAGAGSSGATQGRAATFTFNTDLGPMNNAVGAGTKVVGSQTPHPDRPGEGIITGATANLRIFRGITQHTPNPTPPTQATADSALFRKT